MKVILRMLYVMFLLFIGMKMQQYFDAKQKTAEILTEKEKIALTARFIFMENCTSITEQFTGQSKNSLFQSKEMMKLSTYCVTQAEKVSQFILNQKDDDIKSDYIVEIIDRAMASIKEKELNTESSVASNEEGNFI